MQLLRLWLSIIHLKYLQYLLFIIYHILSYLAYRTVVPFIRTCILYIITLSDRTYSLYRTILPYINNYISPHRTYRLYRTTLLHISPHQIYLLYCTILLHVSLLSPHRIYLLYRTILDLPYNNISPKRRSCLYRIIPSYPSLQRIILPYLCVTLLAQPCCGYEVYKDIIPNGHHVMEQGQAWPGVGHVNREGQGNLNCFGSDLLACGHNWSSLCHLDSDGDGKTNGQELSDPDCVWTIGDVIPPPLSHPGICEPVNLLKCNRYNLPEPICDEQKKPGQTSTNGKSPVTNISNGKSPTTTGKFPITKTPIIGKDPEIQLLNTTVAYNNSSQNSVTKDNSDDLNMRLIIGISAFLGILIGIIIILVLCKHKQVCYKQHRRRIRRVDILHHDVIL